MEIIYIEGDFKAFIDAQKDNATVVPTDGKMRWIVTREDGTKYIARPIETKPDENNKDNQ